MSENGHMEEIMIRFLNGESTGEEAKLLHEWMAQNPANSHEFELVKRLWSDSSEAAMISVDTEKAWKAVSSKTIDKQAKIIKLFPWRKAVAIAASVILVVSALYYFNQPSKTEWNTILAQNNIKRIQLSDGTEITLRKGSQLSVPENFGKGNRQVKLDGEAYFEVKHDEQNPFSVTTSKSIIEDIGTAFLIQSTDSLEQVTVLEGAVSFADKVKNKTPLILKAGESAVLKNEKLLKEKVDIHNVLSWSSKILAFQDTPLSQVATDLQHYYQIEVELPDHLGSIKITAEFRNESLDQVLKELRLFTSLQYKMIGNTLLISK